MLTIRFSGLQEQILQRMVESGVAQTKSEAIRMSLFNLAGELGLLDDKAIVEFLRKEISKTPRSAQEILSQVERIKHETITR